MKTTSDISKKTELKIVELYKSKYTYKDIIKATGATASAIIRTIRKYKIPTRSLNHNMETDRVNKIVKDYIKGESQKKLSIKYRTSMHTIRSILEERNIEIRPNGSEGKGYDEKLLHKIAMEHKKRIGIEKLAKKYHIGSNKLRMLLQTADFEDYDYYAIAKHSGRQSDDFVEFKMNNRYLFKKTMESLGVSKEDIINKIAEIERRHNLAY